MQALLVFIECFGCFKMLWDQADLNFTCGFEGSEFPDESFEGSEFTFDTVYDES